MRTGPAVDVGQAGGWLVVLVFWAAHEWQDHLQCLAITGTPVVSMSCRPRTIPHLYHPTRGHKYIFIPSYTKFINACLE